MKASLIIATLAVAASVSAQAPSDSDLANQWCQVYTATCTQASNTVCGSNFVSKANICKSVVFTNGKCADFSTACGCANAAGVVKNLSEQVLDSTFAAKKGQCADLPRTRVPVNITTGPTATSTGASPSGTTSPEKGNSAGKAATNAVLAVAVAIAAAALSF
ncbi:hypothetical protein BGZ81_010852 [Podila clonocystis]|nr:hypothetical protein BGZ81_010852 [Podila clonocystis]